jgi:hypothetical protein
VVIAFRPCRVLSCLFAKNPYKPRAPSILVGSLTDGRLAAVMKPVGLFGPGVPCFRLQSIRAFPEGLEGLGAGIEDLELNKGKAFHAVV